MNNYDITTKEIDLVGDNNTYIKELYQESSDPDKYAFIKENLDDVRSEKFIAPAHSQDIVKRVLSDRFLLLSGKDRMGKAALSRHIAYMLLQANSDKLSVKKIRQNMDLSEVLDALISEKTQNCIILGYDINIEEIQAYIINVLARIAGQNSKFIIFTSEPSSSIPFDLQKFSIEVQINYPYTHRNIEKLLKQYFQAENIELEVELKGNIHNISKRLISPSVANRLAENLLKEAPLPAYNEWIDRLNALKDFSKEVNNWLSKLGKNERILFLTLALFHDLPDYKFWMVYENVIDILRKRDSTLIELDYYAFEENREFIVSEPSIAFKHIKDRYVILLQLLKLHRRSLLKILSFLGEKIDKFQDKKNWQMRRAIAEAVGCIGTVEREAVNYTLYAWAKHENPSIRAAVGHAHRQMIKVHRQISEDDGDKALSWILDEMERYLKENTEVERDDDNSPKTFGPRWTVAASLGIINNYVSEDRFKQDILPIFEKVYRDEEMNVRVRRAAVFSMRKMGLSRFKQIQPALERKAKDYNMLVRSAVAETLARLSLSNKSDVHQLLKEWLVGQDEDRLWTAIYTIYRLDLQEEDQLNILLQKICANPVLQNKITSILSSMLTSNKLSDKETVISLFESIARRNDIFVNKVLVTAILPENIYKYKGIATDIVQEWIDSDEILLKGLADVVYKNVINIKHAMQSERQQLLKNELNNNELLNDFSERLPEDERDDFWNEVNSKHDEQKLQEIQRKKIMKILSGAAISFFLTKIFFGTGFAIFVGIATCCIMIVTDKKSE